MKLKTVCVVLSLCLIYYVAGYCYPDTAVAMPVDVDMPLKSIHVTTSTCIKPDVDVFKNYIEYLDSSINRSERAQGWDCVDYSVDFIKDNPEWGIVTISKNARFQGRSHMVNYQFYDTTTMIVYDGLLDNLYYVCNWQWDMDYYHFWIDGSQPVRNYRYLLDNRDVVM